MSPRDNTINEHDIDGWIYLIKDGVIFLMDALFKEVCQV